MTEWELKRHQREKRRAQAGLPPLPPLPSNPPLPPIDHARTDEQTIALALRLQGYSMAEIARHLGVGTGKVSRLLAKFRDSAELDDVRFRLQHEAVPMAVDGLIEGLAAGNEAMILETLKGTGYLSPGRAEVPASNMVFQVNVTYPDGHPPSMQMVHGEVVGSPRRLEASDAAEPNKST
jgi:predicted transcriptional regulator